MTNINFYFVTRNGYMVVEDHQLNGTEKQKSFTVVLLN